MKILMPIICLLFCTPIHANEQAPPPTKLVISLHDGSVLHGTTNDTNIKVQYTTISPDPISLNWSAIEKITTSPSTSSIKVELNNGDTMTSQWGNDVISVESSLGTLKVPTRLIKDIKSSTTTKQVNIALGKPVSGRDGASHGKGLAKHVTDGDPSTHAKPPASNFDYTIQLSKEGDKGYDIDTLKVHWGRFGDRFKGIKSSDGSWASAAWPAEYVTSYQIFYRIAGSDQEVSCHSWNGRPAEETGPNVDVERLPTDEAGCSSNSTTTIKNLCLKNVTSLRIQAKGSHWIGLYELEAFGPN